jgi:NAD+ synthase
MFQTEKVKNECVKWIRDFFEENGKGCNAVVGISGGKDSSVVAALCVEALGKDRVIGVLMPNGEQSDIDKAELLTDTLGIKRYIVNIKDSVDGLIKSLPFELSEQGRINLPPRIRMATLYAVAQSHNGRVANTCNLSEDWVGYSTRYGDSVGDFSRFGALTAGEVIAIGDALGLPYDLVHKAPADGLTGHTDEDNFGFSYQELDRYIRTGECPDPDIRKKIDHRHTSTMHKRRPMPTYEQEDPFDVAL